jgi:hypothetical protein
MLRPLSTPGKDQVPIVQEARWAQGRSGQVRKISPLPGFDPRTVQPVVSRYTDWATRPTQWNCTDIVLQLQNVTAKKLTEYFKFFYFII